MEEEKAKNVVLDSSVALLRAHVGTLKAKVYKNKGRNEENEQYQRRHCLRINNIPMVAEGEKESEDDCMVKVLAVIDSLDVEIPATVIDRAHRVGRRRQSKKWGENHPMIVKFTTWRHRTAVYRARKQNKDVSIHLALTKKRLKILQKVQDEVKAYQNAEFCFADVNCNLCIKFRDKFRYFTTEQEANDLLEAHGGELIAEGSEDEGT